MRAAQDAAPNSDLVVFYGVPWETYQGILEAVGKYELDHTYDDGTLEMRRLLESVAREDYLKLMEATPDFSLPHTYDRGALEIIGQQKDHGWVAKLTGRMIESLTLELDIPIQSVGRTSLQSVDFKVGLEPDRSYYIANEPRVRCKLNYDPEHDPPPDLVIEVDVPRSSVPRMPVFSMIGVPELWRCHNLQVQFYRLMPTGRYEAATHSVAFPFLERADVTRFLKQHTEISENALVRGFVAWAREAYGIWRR